LNNHVILIHEFIANVSVRISLYQAELSPEAICERIHFCFKCWRKQFQSSCLYRASTVL